METAAYSHVGNVRRANEDNYFVSSFENNYGFALVADGMGGHKGGKIASKKAVESISEYLTTQFDFENLDIENSSYVIENVSDAISSANSVVYIEALSDEKLMGMGTTVVLAVIKDNELYAANVGDSRLYIINKESIVQVTKDHSMVQEMIDNGTLNKDGAESSVNKNIITRAVGTERTVLADFYRHTLNDGDIVMLCTDGLTNMVSDDEIKGVFDNNEDLDGCVQILVNRANNRGGYDNSTVVAIRV